jgi:sulfite reductase (NADPH) hemoprotein beta-component
VVDPLLWAELMRQWSTFHPEFAFLPRKFKISISGSRDDRAAVLVHDIGLLAHKDEHGEVGFRVIVGGGLGRTPMVGHVIDEFVPWPHLLTYLEAILRVYNRYGRRDNKYKARIKILVKDRTPAKFTEEVREEWEHLRDGPSTVTLEEIERIRGRFTRPAYRKLPAGDAFIDTMVAAEPAFARWMGRNVQPHRVPGYACVTLSLKRTGVPPGDVTAEQMLAVADLADDYSFGEMRVTHEQNLVLADVEAGRLHALWQSLRSLGLATPNIGLLSNIICCPGGDFCSLANAASLPVADAITRRFDDLDYQHDIGEIDLNISGCINACGHHHVGHIGILGVDKAGEEWYQITIGGRQGNDARIGRIIGRSVARHEVADVVSRLIDVYLERRDDPAERFIDVVDRLGLEPFKERVYAHLD